MLYPVSSTEKSTAWPNDLLKKAIPRTPLMYPESYPKRIPPNAAKAQSMYDRSVTGASVWFKTPPDIIEVAAGVAGVEEEIFR